MKPTPYRVQIGDWLIWSPALPQTWTICGSFEAAVTRARQLSREHNQQFYALVAYFATDGSGSAMMAYPEDAA